MNPQQLREVIQQQIQIGLALANSEADGTAPAVSLSASTRRIAHLLQSQRETVATPMQPLPSAECLAAFAEQQTSAAEEQHVLASCIYDMGILFQLVNIFEHRLSQPTEVISAGVMNGLFQMHSQPLVSQPQITNKKWPWLAWAIIAASIIVVLFSARYLLTVSSLKATDDQVSKSLETPELPVPPPGDSSPLVDEHQLVDEGNPTLPLVIAPELAVVNPEDTPPEVSPIPHEPDVPQFVPAPPNQMTTDQPSTKFGHWDQVVGIVASSADREYPKWQAATTANHSAVVGENARLSWMTPPGCYAQTTYGDRGRLVLRENSMASFRMLNDTSHSVPVCDLSYGAIYVSSENAKGLLQIEVAASAGGFQLEFEETASVVAWIEGADLRLLPQGSVSVNGQLLSSGKVVRVTTDQIEIIQQTMEAPAWCNQLPKENVLTRSILGNLNTSEDLAKSVDQQMSRLLARGAATPQSLKLIQQLAQWRVAMDGETPLQSAISPLTPVRLALFGSLMSDTSEQRFLKARRSLLSRIQPEEARRRLQIARLQAQPTRQDIAGWLNELTGDDSELAALADYMFRSQGAAGPDFDPAAPRAQREISKREWIKVVTGK